MNNIYSKIIKYFFSRKKQQKPIIGSIAFTLNKNDRVSMFCELPNVSRESPEQISIIAEKYAKFLLHITDGTIVPDVTKELQNQSKDQNPQTILFIDNVLYFWELLFQENQKKMYKDFFSKEPLVRPSSVFSLKN